MELVRENAKETDSPTTPDSGHYRNELVRRTPSTGDTRRSQPTPTTAVLLMNRMQRSTSFERGDWHMCSEKPNTWFTPKFFAYFLANSRKVPSLRSSPANILPNRYRETKIISDENRIGFRERRWTLRNQRDLFSSVYRCFLTFTFYIDSSTHFT